MGTIIEFSVNVRGQKDCSKILNGFQRTSRSMKYGNEKSNCREEFVPGSFYKQKSAKIVVVRGMGGGGVSHFFVVNFI